MQREKQVEGGALAGAGAGGDEAAAVQLRDAPGDAEAEAEAAVGRIVSADLGAAQLEDRGQLVPAQAAPAVGDAQPGLAFLAVDRVDPDRIACAAAAERMHGEMFQGLLDALRIRKDRQGAFRHVAGQGDFAGRGALAQFLADFAGEPAQFDASTLQLDAAIHQSRRLQQVIDQARQGHRLAFECIQCA